MGLLTPIKNPLDDWDNMPLSHARIGYNNLLTGADASAALKALTPNTYERVGFGAGSPINTDWQTTGSQEIDYVAIAAHNFAGFQIIFQYAVTAGGPYVDIESITPADNSAIMILLDEPITIQEIRLVVSNSDGERELGVIHAGMALQMYQPIYGGHSPIDLSATTEYFNTMSDTGQFLGQTIIRKGLNTQYAWQHLDPDWYRERFEPFVQSSRRYPFFIKWRPDLYDVTAYGFATADIKPQNMGGGHRLMSVGFQMRAHADL